MTMITLLFTKDSYRYTMEVEIHPARKVVCFTQQQKKKIDELVMEHGPIFLLIMAKY